MALIELIVILLAIASAGGVVFWLYRAATRPAGDAPVSPDDLPPVDNSSEPEDAGRSPVELL